MNLTVRKYTENDIGMMTEIWNEVVLSADAFPQLDCLNKNNAADFFASQSYCGICEDEETGAVVGLYILHPNNVGRCGHIANASFAVKNGLRGNHIGEMLVRDCLIAAKNLGFQILQFNAVVKSNIAAHKLYEKLGFVKLGTVPGGFLKKDGNYEDIVLYYHTL